VSRAGQFRSLLRSEWTKLWSVRFGAWCTAVYVFVVLGAGLLAAASTQTAPEPDLAVETALTGFGFGQLVLVVFGVLAVTSEYSSGNVLVAVIAVPRRTNLLVAKTVVVGVWSALLSVVLAVLCAVAAARLTQVPGGVSLTDPAVLRVIGLQVAAATLVAVLALAIGTVVRSSAGAVGAGSALVFFAPLLVALAPDWAARSAKAMPALRVGRDTFLAEATTWQVGTAVTAAWAIVAWLLGAALLERRDV
jgi:ABC-type transport system involved in multi-copper enzyme maturation permease subunit